MSTFEETARKVLASADIRIGGDRPQDIQVHDNRLYARVIRDGDLGLGEAYMDGWWDASQLDMFFAQLLQVDPMKAIKLTPGLVAEIAKVKLFNQQSVGKTKSDLSHHYDIGNDLYEQFLDTRMIYSCAYWKDAKTLDQAQEAKLDLVCRKLELKPGMTVLDIGCGWGGFAKYAAEKYGVHVTGISPAREQVELARERTAGLNIDIVQSDYRDMTGTFDRIVSIGMLEHVGGKNYRSFFDKCDELLAEDGIMLHHTISGSVPYRADMSRWMRKYIFPGTYLPTLGELSGVPATQFAVEDVQNLGEDYHRTLLEWDKRFRKNYKKLDQDKYDERFYRMWRYYLLICAGLFHAHSLYLYQVVYRRQRPAPTYRAPR